MYERPTTLDSALASLSEGSWSVLAGGTDFYPALGDRHIAGPVLDITALDELRGIRIADDGWHFGALTTWSDIVRADLPPAFEGLKLAAREVGSVQIQNRATVAGNLCNASPAADGVPPLLTLDAEIQLSAASGSRRVRLADFIDGYRSTVLGPGELVTAVIVPKAAGAGRSSFLKLGARRYLVISIAMAAARIELDASGLVERAAVAVGACSAVAQRLAALEADLVGHDAAGGFKGVIGAGHLRDLSPIGDVRASAEYRHEAAGELVERALNACAGERLSA
ncbi:MAG: FAD binding domain-containing protein [Rhizobiaceae bacterium]